MYRKIRSAFLKKKLLHFIEYKLYMTDPLRQSKHFFVWPQLQDISINTFVFENYFSETTEISSEYSLNGPLENVQQIKHGPNKVCFFHVHQKLEISKYSKKRLKLHNTEMLKISSQKVHNTEMLKISSQKLHDTEMLKISSQKVQALFDLLLI